MIKSKSEYDIIRQRMHDDFLFYAPNFLKIKTKQMGIVPLVVNDVQRKIHTLIQKQRKETGKVRAVILKARQQGCSTYIAARFYWLVTHAIGKKAFIMSHDRDSANTLFDMIKRFHDNIHPRFSVSVDTKNAKQLRFDKLDSSFSVGTAGSAYTGRGDMIHMLHASEVAYWDNAPELVSGLLQCVPDASGTECIFESTSSGQNNFFHTLWLKAIAGEVPHKPIFIPWYSLNEYAKQPNEDFEKTDEEIELAKLHNLTDAQLQWRREKIAEFELTGVNGLTLFKREYPTTADEAFLSSDSDAFIKSESVFKARKHECNGYGPLVIGVDPATEDGKDSTAIIRRRGREAFNLATMKCDLMALTGKLVEIIKKEKPEAVNVDVIGIGRGVVDRLNELGYRDVVKPINAAAASLFPDRYFNKRHEMYGELKAWLTNENSPVSIPDNEQLQMDLCCIGHRYDSSGRFRLPTKEEIRGVLKKSPDTADALALTFATPIQSSDAFNYAGFLNPTLRI